MIPDPNDRPTLTVGEVARALGISRSHAYQMAEEGRLPVLRFGRRVLVLTAQLRPLLGLEPNEKT